MTSSAITWARPARARHVVNAAHTPGILRHLTDVLSKENINLSHLFASASLEQDECLVVLNSSDNDRAIVLLNR